MRADTQVASAALHLGPALPAWLRRSMSCDATLRYVLHDVLRDVLQDDATELWSKPLAYGPRRRSVSRTLRTLVQDRDRGCRVPWCAQRRWLHVHHLVHYEDGGPTQLDNLVALSPAHHRLHHRGALDITGDPTRRDGLVFTDPVSGRTLDRAGLPVPLGPDEHPAEAAERQGIGPGNFRHGSGERMDSRWIHFADHWPDTG